MNDNAKAWVAELRSGKHEQSTCQLCVAGAKGDSYCCLGIACLICPIAPDGWKTRALLPKAVTDWLGLRTSSGKWMANQLTTENDIYCKTFSQIADIIESEPEGLFL